MVNEDCFYLGVKALIINSQGKVLILQLSPKKVNAGKVRWDLPGGRIQRNETLEMALKREVFEETGLQLAKIEPLSMGLSSIRLPLNDNDAGLIFTTYTCRLEETPSIQLSDEHTLYKWVDPEEAARSLVDFPAVITQNIAKL